MSSALRSPRMLLRLGAFCLFSLAGPATAAELITLFPAPGGPLGVAPGPDGNLWFTQVLYGVGRITPSGVVTDFPIFPVPLDCSTGLPYGCGTWGITSGPDGNMWFVGTMARPSTARITTGGVATGVDVGMHGPQLSIIVGADGNLWTAPYGPSTAYFILRVTPAGVLSAFPIVSQVGFESTGAYDLTAGPDANVWFTEPLQRRIGRITPTGVITEFPLPISLGFPYAIVGGPDGNVWFTAAGGSAGDFIGRITPAGAITTFVIAGRPGRCEDICVGADGNLWFSETNLNRIGRCTLRGEITEYPISLAQGYPFGITAGPDGNIWFAAPQFGIGRVNLSYIAALEAQKVPSLELWAVAALVISLAFAGSFLLRGRA